MVFVTEQYINHTDVLLVCWKQFDVYRLTSYVIRRCLWQQSIRWNLLGFCYLSLPVQVCIGNAVTKEKHNRAQTAALCPPFIHHVQLNSVLTQAINAAELQHRALLIVTAASRHKPQRSQSTSYPLTSQWKQQAGIKAASRQDKTYVWSSYPPRSSFLCFSQCKKFPSNC